MTLVKIAFVVIVGVLVFAATLRAADPPSQQQTPSQAKVSAKLSPGVEEKLKWGEPVNGLRAAIVIRPAPGDTKEDAKPELYVAVQNVSDAPIHLNDTKAAPKDRELFIRIDGETIAGFYSNDPNTTDVRLNPREVTSLPLFPKKAGPDGREANSTLAQEALKDLTWNLFVTMNIENAPAGAWTGKLETGETTAAVAAGKPYIEPPKVQPKKTRNRKPAAPATTTK